MAANRDGNAKNIYLEIVDGCFLSIASQRGWQHKPNEKSPKSKQSYGISSIQ
jgi:hypothetical protein